MLIATLLIPALDDAKEGEGGGSTETVTEEITGAVGRYSKVTAFTLTYSADTGSVLDGETWAANKSGEGAIICDNVLFLNRDTGPSFYMLNADKTQGLRGTATSATLSNGVVTLTSTNNTTYTVNVGFCYVPDSEGDYAVTRTTNKTTIVNEDAPVVLWVGTNTEYAVISGTVADRHLDFWVKTGSDPAIQTVPPTLLYEETTLEDTTAYTLTGGNPSTPSLVLTPYTYTYEKTGGGSGGLLTPLNALLDSLPVLAIIAVMLGAVAFVYGRRDD